jgi:ectoine hydroxylase-related dioxygenase (phytanoyl-CoA dioxygenase family)
MLNRDACSIDDFAAVVETEVDLDDYPHASKVEFGTLVYDADTLRAGDVDPTANLDLRGELARAFSTGPGIVAFHGAVEADVVDRVSASFRRMIARQHAKGSAVGDHYAKPGANDRVWNAIEKLAIDDPEAFVDYYANDMIALGALAWLGPGYQISSQVNVVNPGGEAQRPHRDYHIGFMTDAVAEHFPTHAHRLSPMLTLQGAVAHCEMPVESGPTMYLPHSHKYELGYLAWRRAEFMEYFDQHRVQLPLRTGDLVFFNPALFHAAGSNRTVDVARMANLLQISSAMGRAMETMDRIRMALAVYPALQLRRAAGVPDHLLAHALVACADGYAFPTNLDRDPPVDGLTPPSQLDIVSGALVEGVDCDELEARLDSLAVRRSTR